MLAAILMVGSGATLVIFMNSLWDDSKLLTYIDLDTDSMQVMTFRITQMIVFQHTTLCEK